MTEFTKEEISLCKQIAEKHRREIKKRQYYYNAFLKRIQWSGEDGQSQASWAIPLWTISDCLEFLKKKCRDHVLLIHDEGDEKEWWLWMDEYKETQQVGSGKTPLEACLKAVIEVLKNAKI
ncbi:MAG: hypothetical protein E3J87_03505 [Candidatus Cloacimonadota bacterium]|nr:MAG: hypothetical protein E3J87_03505 [Candidatus Cloacimonadota bacterium]